MALFLSSTKQILNEIGAAGGLATLNASSKVVEVALDSEKLGNVAAAAYSQIDGDETITGDKLFTGAATFGTATHNFAPQNVISVDMTLYCHSAGTDTATTKYFNGSEAIITALEWLKDKWINNNVTVTLQVKKDNAGNYVEYSYANSIVINHPCGNRIKIIGNTDADTTDAITGVNQGTKKFTVAGDKTANYQAGMTMWITGSTGNDGLYNVIGSALVSTDTEIEVLEAIADTTADGTIYCQTRSKCCIVFTATGGGCFSIHSKGPEIYGFSIKGNTNQGYGIYIEKNSDVQLYDSATGLEYNIIQFFEYAVFSQINSIAICNNTFMVNNNFGLLSSGNNMAYTVGCAVSNVTNDFVSQNSSFIDAQNVVTAFPAHVIGFSPAVNTVGNNNSFILN